MVTFQELRAGRVWHQQRGEFDVSRRADEIARYPRRDRHRYVPHDAGHRLLLDRGDSRTYDVFVGSESFLLANMRNGGVGTISATANVNPAAIHKLYEKCSGVCVKRRGNRKALAAASASITELEDQQAQLNVVRDVFSNRKFPSMIATLKQAIAIYGNDPEWTRMRPPLVELTTEQAESLAAELKAIEFTMPGIG